MDNQISAQLLRRMFLAGAKHLDEKKEWINELNVFPVPDGDTGTNMTMTIMSAAREVAGLEDATLESLAKAMSSGSLRGARGNSGVILSQLCRGFSKEIRELSEVDAHALASAMHRAAETAYKAVMKPKEGTILTVARCMAEEAVRLDEAGVDSLEEMLPQLLQKGNETLEKTPEMLPVLKQAGVVDSGGQGLMVLLEGAYDAFLGKEVPLADGEISHGAASASGRAVSTENIDTSDIKFGYCTEFIINLEKPYGEAEEEDLKAFLESIGDSIVCVSMDDIVKIHVHTNHPGQAFEKGLTLGSLSNMKVDNMRIEHKEKLFKESEKQAYQKAEEEKKARKAEEEAAAAGPAKEAGFIAVSVGEGLDEIFKELGVDEIIAGGQTMNPSTEDLLNAAAKVNAETIYILPNNGNIILAAEQAAQIEKKKRLVVVPTRSVPQGITAVISYLEGRTPEENLEEMKEAVAGVKTGQVTYAVRHTMIGGTEICEGDIMGLGDHGLLCAGKDLKETTLEMIRKMTDGDTEVVTIYYGEGVSEEDAQEVADLASEELPEAEVELEYGGQPIYYYLVSAE